MIRPRLISTIVSVAMLGTIGFAQQFEVASIRVNKADNSGVDGRRISIQPSPGNLRMRNVTLMSCVRWAFNVHDFQIQGGPSWRDSERYDIEAKPSSASTEDQLRVMLQALLADRFKLAVRRESKETPVYVLTVGKTGPRLKPSKEGGPRSVRLSGNGIILEDETIPDLVLFMSGLPSFDRPVIDHTDLAGHFDIILNLVPGADIGGDPAGAKAAVANGPTAFIDALDALGLKLELQKIPMDNIVIERAEKPTEN